jgi:hypothetical protein
VGNQLSTTPWRYMRAWRYSSTILDLSTRWRWVVSFMHRPLYSQGMRARCPVDRRLGGLQSRVRYCGEDKNLLPLPGIERWPSSPQSVTIVTEVSRLHVMAYAAENYEGDEWSPCALSSKMACGKHSWFLFRRCLIHISTRVTSFLTEFSQGFLQSFQTNAGIVPLNRPQPLPLYPFQFII